MIPLLLMLLLGPAQAAPDGAGADTPEAFRVRPGGATTLEAALRAAAPGDTIRLAAGTHHGPVRIDRKVVVIGDAGAVLDGRRRGSVVTLAADSIEVIGLIIRGSGRSLDGDDAGVKVERCRGCRVVGSRIEDSLHGIYLLEAHEVTIVWNDITGDPELPEPRRGNGIHLFHSTGNRIERNQVRGTRDGIYFSFASENDVAGNRVSGVRYGLHYMYSDDNRFTGNEFRRNAAGAAIMFSHRVAFTANTFADHVGYRAYGILLQTSTGIAAEGNRVTGNLVGVYLDNALGNRFTGNLIAGNGVGVDMLTSAERNTFTRNAITDNRVPVRVSRGGGVNRWAEHGRGNWWGHGTALDLDGDGVGDRPFRAGDPFASLAHGRPALEAFAGTVAARALSWAERAFPVFGIPAVEDPAPLARPPAGMPDASGATSTRRRP